MSAIKPLPLGLETILLVEDADGVRDVARRELERLGYNVIAVASATAALEFARSFNGAIDLLVTDVVMPEMSGGVLAKRFAQHHPRVRLLFISGYTDDGIVGQGAPSTEASYLQKPFSPQALASRVRAILDS